MKLPKGNEAVVLKTKLLEYLLSETHPVGSSKAKFFRALKFDETNTAKLTKSLLKIARDNEVKSIRKFKYGINYMIEGEINTPSGKKVPLITVWFAKTEKSKASFVTAYPV